MSLKLSQSMAMIFSSVMFVAFLGVPCAAQTETGFDLSGVVRDVKGNPIAGVSVWIYTAAPRVGRGFT